MEKVPERVERESGGSVEGYGEAGLFVAVICEEAVLKGSVSVGLGECFELVFS